jgi:carboxylesterase
MERIYRSPEPFFLDGHGECASTLILAVHGFTGSPAEFRRVGYFLQERGYSICAPQLPGHGTTPEDMIQTGWSDWYGHVLDTYQGLRGRYERVIPMGHSMGGLLALKLACEQEVAGVLSLAAPIYLQSRKTALAFLLKYWISYVDKNPITDEQILQDAWTYSKTPIPCVVSLRKLIRMMKQSLRRIEVPIFIGQGERDGTVQPRSASYIYARVSSPYRRLKWYSDTSHAILLDRERDQVYEDILSFIETLTGSRKDAEERNRAY